MRKKDIVLELVTVSVLCDFSKAFDTISYDLLSSKLPTFGFSDSVLTWFHSYLTRRSQSVIGENSEISDWLPTTFGVPYSSVPRPLLVSLFINDTSNFWTFSTHLIFADDTRIYLFGAPANISHGFTCVPKYVEKIAEYYTSSGFTLDLLICM